MTLSEIAKIGQIVGLCNELLEGTAVNQPPQSGEPITPPAGPAQPGAQNPVNANPYADSPAMVKLISDDHLIAGPKIMDNIMSSRYWRKLWEISHEARVPLVILRGAHPDGCADFAYPTINGLLDKEAMIRIRDAFLKLAVPHYHPGQEWRYESGRSPGRIGCLAGVSCKAYKH